MNKVKTIILTVVFTITLYFGMSTVMADDVMKDGVSIGGVDVSGMTAEEASEMLTSYADESGQISVVLIVDESRVETTLWELGYSWNNEEVIDEAINVGNKGNVIKRYEDNKKLENDGIDYEMSMGITVNDLQESISSICEPYETEMQNATLKATGSGFKIISGKKGLEVDAASSASELYTYITEEWDGESSIEYSTVTEVISPEYTKEDCEKVSSTPMGSYTTTFSVGSSYENRNNNIKHGTEIIDGTVLYPGESYSCNENMAPWTEDNGWYPAGTYVEGGVEDSYGGGICQVSSTLYNALLDAEIQVDERYSHSMTVSYVPLAADAALAGDYKDLIFTNDTDAPIYIQGVYSSGGSVSFYIYGHDTRSASHSVEYVSETIETIAITTKKVKDSTLAKGTTEVEDSGQTGYVATLTKVTYEDGVEVSRELLHTSTYAMQQKVVRVGTKTTSSDSSSSDDDDSEEETTTKKSSSKKKSSEETTTKKKKNSDDDE